MPSNSLIISAIIESANIERKVRYERFEANNHIFLCIYYHTQFSGMHSPDTGKGTVESGAEPACARRTGKGSGK